MSDTCREPYRPHPNTTLELRISNALRRLNLDRPDIAALKDGQTIQRNIADDRWLAALLEDLQQHLTAAPELLHELQLKEAWIVNYVPPETEGYESELAGIRAAIAKATGGEYDKV